MLRTIMIFPQFDNMEIIDEIRALYDPLSGLVRPHVTLVFPFESQMTNAEIEKILESSLKYISPFELVLHGFGFSKSGGNFLFLNIEKGSEIVEAMHDELYSTYFRDYEPDFPYDPHMTVGKLDDEKELDNAYECVKDLDVRFRTIVKKISVEMIGEHNESIIIFEKMLD